MPNAMNIGFSFPTYINILAGASPPPNRDAQGVHRRIEAGQDGQIRRRRRRAMMTFAALCRRRDPGCIDPLRHVFEDAMSDMLPLRRTRFLTHAAGRLTSR